MTGTLLITGGGRGIGAATAKLAASRGWRICLSYERDSDAEAVVVRAIEEGGGQAVAVRADVRQESNVRALFDAGPRRRAPKASGAPS